MRARHRTATGAAVFHVLNGLRAATGPEGGVTWGDWGRSGVPRTAGPGGTTAVTTRRADCLPSPAPRRTGGHPSCRHRACGTASGRGPDVLVAPRNAPPMPGPLGDAAAPPAWPLALVVPRADHQASCPPVWLYRWSWGRSDLRAASCIALLPRRPVAPSPRRPFRCPLGQWAILGVLSPFCGAGLWGAGGLSCQRCCSGSLRSGLRKARSRCSDGRLRSSRQWRGTHGRHPSRKCKRARRQARPLQYRTDCSVRPGCR